MGENLEMLVRAQELVDSLEKDIIQYKTAEPQLGTDAVNKILAFEQGCWISVKDRLPEFKKSVQTWDGQKQWVDYLESVTEGRFHNRRNVTHWKPLGLPPCK